MMLSRSHLSLRPTQHGIIFLAILIAMLLGSINYNNNAGFTLVFLLGTMALISLFHSYKNLLGLHVTQQHVQPVFIGQTVIFKFQAKGGNPGGQPASGQALSAGFNGMVSVPFSQQASGLFADLKIKSKTRGHLNPGDLVLVSNYPFGLFRLTARIPIESKGLVYPAPLAGPIPSSLSGDREEGEKSDPKAGPDDFQGLAPYVPGNPMGRISWKTYSRGLGIFIKNFTAETGGEMLLDMTLIKSNDLEQKLSILCRAILDAEKGNIRYGLRLSNGVNINPNQGKAHCHHCLKALALYGSPVEAS